MSFPNTSRSYDKAAHGVRFWGHDRTLEVSFFINEKALENMSSRALVNERGFLRMFDLNVGRIREMAGTRYSRQRAGSHVFSFTLTDTDFE